jgi:polyisoprenoid-binding protein YceI
MTDTVTLPGSQLTEDWLTGTWTIDPVHSTVGFAVRHLMSRVRGTFSEFSGQIVTDARPARSSVTAAIGLSSVSTGFAMRDAHLRSADFFDVEHHPLMTFASTGLRPVGDAWILSGELTIGDVTRPVELDLEFLGSDPTGMQGETRIGFSARGTISRRAFGVAFGLATDGSKIVIADKVELTLDIEAVLDTPGE